MPVSCSSASGAFGTVAVPVLVLLAAVAPQTSRHVAIEADAIRHHMAVLAHDSMAGRGTATPGHEAAARYLAARFAGAGLKSIGGSWLHQVPLRRARLDPSESFLRLTAATADFRLRHGEDYLGTAQFTPSAAVQAEVVYAGHGISAPDLGHDDYAGLEVRGRIVAVRSGVPEGFSVAARTWYGGIKAQTAAEHGAAGLVQLWADEDGDWSAYRRLGGDPTRWAWRDGGEPNSVTPGFRAMAVLGPEATAFLLRASGAASVRDLRPGLISARAHIATVAHQEDLQSPNVIGLLNGSDSVLAEEYVVVTAHLDHLGTGLPVAGDSIYNGAVDNASGVAALLEIARALSGARSRSRRSILFVAFTAEEPGSVGSDWFVRHPPVPFDRIVANVNIDGASVWPFVALVLRGAEHSTLGALAGAAATAGGFRLAPDPGVQSFSGSDHYAFVRAGVPAMIISAVRTPAARSLALDWVRNRYHQPSDDLTQPVDYQAAAAFTRGVALMVAEIGNSPERPGWLAADFYGGKARRP